MKQCPYCAEEIQDKAILCRFCRKEVGDNAVKVSEVRGEIGKQIAYLERDITKLGNEINDVNVKIQEAQKGQRTAGLMIIIGLFLTPVGIGIFLVIIGFMGLNAGPKNEEKLKNEKQELQTKLDESLSNLATLKAELAVI